MTDAPFTFLDSGFVRVARIEMPDERTFNVIIELSEARKWTKSVYAIVIGGKIRRLGSSKGPLGSRLGSWNRDITRTLHGHKTSSPLWEAHGWRDFMAVHGSGEVLARVGTTVVTPAGTFEAYMDEESILIQRYTPSLNRHTNR